MQHIHLNDETLRRAWADITDESQCQRLADSAAKRFGRIDAITQVAALDRVFGGLAEVTREEWMNAYELGVVGSAQLVSATAPHLKKPEAGSVIFIGSRNAGTDANYLSMTVSTFAGDSSPSYWYDSSIPSPRQSISISSSAAAALTKSRTLYCSPVAMT